MAEFLPAYDKRTGRKLPHPVPAHWFNHPVLGANLSKTPSAGKRRARRTTATNQEAASTTTEAPAAGDDQKE